MEIRPNDAPTMEKGEVRYFTLNVSGAAGVNSITGSPTAECERLTIGTPSASGLEVSFLVTADNVGTHNIIVTCELDSSETIKGFIRAKVVDSTCNSNERDYG